MQIHHHGRSCFHLHGSAMDNGSLRATYSDPVLCAGTCWLLHRTAVRCIRVTTGERLCLGRDLVVLLGREAVCVQQLCTRSHLRDRRRGSLRHYRRGCHGRGLRRIRPRRGRSHRGLELAHLILREHRLEQGGVDGAITEGLHREDPKRLLDLQAELLDTCRAVEWRRVGV